MNILEVVASQMDKFPVWMQGLVGMFMLAKAITVFTPTQIDDKYFGKATVLINGMLKVLNIQALNIGKDKNADSRK